MTFRTLERRVKGQKTSDGDGVKLTRVLTHDLQKRLDPFLMLDAFGSDESKDYIGGFPDHPHRGFETITYMLEGRMRHKDNAGHEGLLSSGGVQWMTAGKGVIHSEMPEQENGRMEGFQLWLNLPSQQKMCMPAYQEFEAQHIPQVLTATNVIVKIIAGHYDNTQGAVQRPTTTPLYLDLHFPDSPVKNFEIQLPKNLNAFIYVYEGNLTLVSENSQELVSQGEMAILKNDGDLACLLSNARSKAIVIAGQPLGEPIAQYGPFVMNTQQEVMQAVRDFQQGLF